MQKPARTREVWYKLDNAAIIFPAVSGDRNTNVFRLCCELRENVDPEILQQALDIAMRSFPYFRVVMRRGLFWFYLERSELLPKVELENERPCNRIFYKNVKELLLRVSYYNRRVNLEVFHSVADGAGAIQLLHTMIHQYILLRYAQELPENLPAPHNEAPPSHMEEDSFRRYYKPGDKKSPFKRKAFTIAGTLLPSGTISVIEATVPTGQMLALAKSKGATITAYLAALLIFSIYRELMPRRAVLHNIGLTIPVDLRGHFVSESSRNFFSVVEVNYNFSQEPDDFDSVLRSVAEQLSKKVDKGALSARLSYTMAVQKNILTRFTPLFLKNLILRIAYHKAETCTTSALSNMGRITVPEPFNGYISRFVCLLNPTALHRVKACVCSFEDQLVIAFSSCIAETQAQKFFVRHLTQNGVEVCLRCNGVNNDEIL